MPAGITQTREIQSSMMARIVRAVSPATFGGRPYRRRVGDQNETVSLKWPMHSAQQPLYAERNGDGRIGFSRCVRQ
jgi:hypothetical protein